MTRRRDSGQGLSGLIVVLQYSWKLDSSTATTGYGSGSVTTSRIGVPTFPAAILR